MWIERMLVEKSGQLEITWNTGYIIANLSIRCGSAIPHHHKHEVAHAVFPIQAAIELIHIHDDDDDAIKIARANTVNAFQRHCPLMSFTTVPTPLCDHSFEVRLGRDNSLIIDDFDYSSHTPSHYAFPIEDYVGGFFYTTPREFPGDAVTPEDNPSEWADIDHLERNLERPTPADDPHLERTLALVANDAANDAHIERTLAMVFGDDDDDDDDSVHSVATPELPNPYTG